MNFQMLNNLAEAFDNFLDRVEKRSAIDYEAQRRRLEQKINQIIQQAWAAQTEKAFKEAVRLLEQYGRQLEKLDAQAVADGLAPVMSAELVQSTADNRLIDHIHYAYDMAGQKTATQLKLPYAFTFVDQQVKDWLVKDAVYWIGNFYDSFIKDAVTKTVIQYAIEEGQDYWITGQRIKEVLAGTYEIPPKYLPASYIRAEAYWQLVSCEAVTRATVLGRIEPMLAADVEEYEILTAEDERVCPLCSRMHGKKFKIEHAVELRNKFLEAKTPEDVKLVHPWNKVQEIDSWEPEALARRGMALPSFHGHCRCDIVVSRFREYIKSLEPVIKYPGQLRDRRGRFAPGKMLRRAIYVKEEILLPEHKAIIKSGTYIKNVEVMAKGEDIKVVDRLINTYKLPGGKITDKKDWQKMKGHATIIKNDRERKAEVHWYQCKNIGKVEWKVKRFLK